MALTPGLLTHRGVATGLQVDWTLGSWLRSPTGSSSAPSGEEPRPGREKDRADGSPQQGAEGGQE